MALPDAFFQSTAPELRCPRTVSSEGLGWLEGKSSRWLICAFGLAGRQKQLSLCEETFCFFEDLLFKLFQALGSDAFVQRKGQWKPQKQKHLLGHLEVADDDVALASWAVLYGELVFCSF